MKNKVLAGNELSWDEVLQLGATHDHEALWAAAEEITRAMCPRQFDSCSIANARSGRCSENCKWCAQSAHFHTGCNEYDLIDRDECMRQAIYNHKQGIKRFSLVTSGRAMKGKALDSICSMLSEVKEKVGISTCASLGLLDSDDLRKLWDAGVRRYHCNLEAAPSYFPKLCTTHTIDDKLRTIREAQAIGFEVCSGGIIGMGETAEQRYELAYKLKEVSPHSIPINILCPIP
ncbi:MAG: biotin synthase BioB, partial [Muribaculaceae bacterium]|nr:biotin synthase BioB [Muribaculaceae bacterium]